MSQKEIKDGDTVSELDAKNIEIEKINSKYNKARKNSKVKAELYEKIQTLVLEKQELVKAKNIKDKELKQEHKEEIKNKITQEMKNISFSGLDSKIKQARNNYDNCREGYETELYDKLQYFIQIQKEKFPEELREKEEKIKKEMKKYNTPRLTVSMSFSDFREYYDENEDWSKIYKNYKKHMREYYTDRKREIPQKWLSHEDEQ